MSCFRFCVPQVFSLTPLRGAQFLSQSFDLELTGILFPHRQGTATELRGKAELKVRVDVPPPLKLLPDSVVQQSGRAFLNGILSTIKYRLERQLVQDYRRWVKANPAELMSPLAMPVGSPAS